MGTGAWAAQYNLDASHSRMGFKIRHLGVSWVKGQFNDFTGSGDYDAKTGKIGSLKVTIKATSINTNEPDRDKHLRSKDFFEVETYKELVFESTKIEYVGNKPAKIHGKLSLHGVTKDVTLTVSDWGGAAEDPWGNQRVAFSAEGKISRKDFGMTWNKGLKKANEFLIGDEVRLEIEAEGIQPAQ